MSVYGLINGVLSGLNVNQSVATTASPQFVSLGVGCSATSHPLSVEASSGIIDLTSTTGTNSLYLKLINTSGSSYFGIENSTGGNILDGGLPYAMVFVRSGEYPIQLATNDTLRLTISSAGLITNEGALYNKGDIYTTAWTAWSPTIAVEGGGTAPTFGAITKTRYRTVGKILYWEVNLLNVSGGTAGSGTGTLTISLPVAISSNYFDNQANGYQCCVGYGHIYSSSGASNLNVSVQARQSSTNVALVSDASYASGNSFGGDVREISIQGQYEIN